MTIVEVGLQNEEKEMMTEGCRGKNDGRDGNSGVMDEVILEDVHDVLKNDFSCVQRNGRRWMKRARAV